MNLNFYPNNYNQQPMNPYFNLLGIDNNKVLQNFQQTAENQLQNLQQNIQNQFAPQNQTQQPYYLYCGNKNDWDEFLMLNYGITERNIFDDYKLFLQAKQELVEEQGQNKINTMKDKLKNKDTMVVPDASIQSNVKPTKQPNNVNRNPNSVNNGDISKPNNRQLEHNNKQIKQ